MSLKRTSEIVFLVLVPLILFLLIAEVLLRVYLSSHIFYDVEMSRYALALKVDSPNPLIGHHHRPRAEATLMGVSIRTNEDGFRDDDYPMEKGDRRRIIFLGDSLTLGWGVEKEQTFEHVLERDLGALSPTEIINFGTGNYNTTQEVHLLIDKGIKYDPDQVVLFYFINDAEPVPQKSRFPGLGNYRIITFYWSRIKALKARIRPTAGFQEYYSTLYREGSDGWEKSKAALRRLEQLSREHGFDLKVVLLPEFHELVDYTFAKEHEQVTAFLDENDIPVLDLAPFFRNERNPQALWVARDDAHPNARAHRLIAEYTLDFLAENGGP
ncbi:SGNH/GDSL hydrolase family protein [bacterium]|nr:SGNH/GDSL hydrolase family protein [bacterium]